MLYTYKNSSNGKKHNRDKCHRKINIKHYEPNTYMMLPHNFVQRGETCKLYALGNAMLYLATKYKLIVPRVRKDKKTEVTTSLRQLAKTKYGSQVGEMYNPSDLQSLSKDFYYDANLSNRFESYKDYIEAIKIEVDDGSTPIIFFNVNTSTGQPLCNKSIDREHAAIVIGYKTMDGHINSIKISQWGQIYSINPFELFNATLSLPEAEDKEPEIFEKLPGQQWHNVTNTEMLKLYKFMVYNSLTLPQNIRAAKLPNISDGGLKCKIMTISVTPHLAAKSNNPYLIRTLIEKKGYDVDAKIAGKTALSVARESEATFAIEMLLSLGAKESFEEEGIEQFYSFPRTAGSIMGKTPNSI